MYRLTSAALSCWSTLLATSSAALGIGIDNVQVDPDTGFFRDSHGRVRIFHGVNVVYKKPPWFPPSDGFNTFDSYGEETWDLLREWGFNVVRLGVLWEGVEPAPGVINETYLDEVAQLISGAATRGIHTLVDCHQDVGSGYFCGEGFPPFYIDELAADPESEFSKAKAFPYPWPFEVPRGSDGRPPLSVCLNHTFTDYYLTEKVGAMWAELYTPGSRMNEGFKRYWKAVAQKFNNDSAVLFYELLNEPSMVCLKPGLRGCERSLADVFLGDETEYLVPLYEAAFAVIRSVDPKTPIFYEPAVEPQLGGLFPRPPPRSPVTDDPQQGLSYHIYCPQTSGEGLEGSAKCDLAQDVYTDLYYSYVSNATTAGGFRVGGFMTEFGAISDERLEIQNIERLLGKADSVFQSWAYWSLKYYHDITTINAAESLWAEDGTLEVAKLKALSRTYAMAIAGTPIKMDFAPSTAQFELQFLATTCDAPTEVYLNEKLHYPNGYTYSVSPKECMRMQQKEPNYLNFVLQPACKGSQVAITIQQVAAKKASNLIAASHTSRIASIDSSKEVHSHGQVERETVDVGSFMQTRERFTNAEL